MTYSDESSDDGRLPPGDTWSGSSHGEASADPATEDATPIALPLGAAMPPVETDRLPTLATGQPTRSGDTETAGPASSRITDGMSYRGNAQLTGPLSIGGIFEGNVGQRAGSTVSVVVTETGFVTGNITADKVSVMGVVDGLIDAGSGHVALHDGSSISGHVRYGRIQVNGADLNATLERVAGAATGNGRTT